MRSLIIIHYSKTKKWSHCSDVIIGAMTSQITGLTIVYWTVYSDADQRKHQSSATLAFVHGSHLWPAQMGSNAETLSIWWRHHEICKFLMTYQDTSHKTTRCKYASGIHRVTPNASTPLNKYDEMRVLCRANTCSTNGHAIFRSYLQQNNKIVHDHLSQQHG